MGTGSRCHSGPELIGLKLDILGRQVDFRIRVWKDHARLSDIVPLARTLCTKITDTVVQSIHSDGGRVPCHKGCSACCSYLVPLSVPEAFWLKEEVSAAPAHRRESAWRACLCAARHILSHKCPEPFTRETGETSLASPVDRNLVSSWYSNLRLACPFLRNDVCTIYDQRPLACREHFVKDSPEACGDECGVAEPLEMPVQVPNVLGQLASELESTSVEAVILPLALVWCEENPERSERTWPAAMMVERFAEIMETMAWQNSAAPVR